MTGLSVEGLSFGYHRGAAPLFDDVTVALAPGKTVLLGRNGAGKSTLLSLMASILTPAKGAISLDGVPLTRATKRHFRGAVSFLPQSVPVMDGFTVRESVEYAGWLKGLSRRETKARAPHAIDRVDLNDKAASKAERLSGGQLRRLGIAQALVHDAQVLLLDEPAAGLDPIQQRELRDLLAGIDPGIQVVVSTHQTQDIDDIYDHVLVIDSGTVIWHGRTEEFTSFAPSKVPQHLRADWTFEALIRGANSVA